MNTTSFYIPENQTVCWSVYRATVAECARLPETFLRQEAKRIDRAFRFGEPPEMIADELKLVFELTGNYRPTKTPLQLARRIVRMP